MIKTIITAGLTALVVALVVGMLVGSNSPAVGGDTRFPNSDLSAKSLSLTGTGTTTLSVGKVCMTVVQSDGGTSYAYFDPNGSLATSTATCE